MPQLHALAASYIARGWPVHPVQAGGKRPASAHGCHDATLDAAQVARWWRHQPAYNIGIATGRAGRQHAPDGPREGHTFDVLDLDGDAGLESYATFADANSIPFDLESQYVVATPSGGYHLYFQPTGHGNRGAMLPDVDWRGRGGYVVAAGSIRPDGNYELWHDGPIPPAPAALVELVARLEAPGSAPAAHVDPLPPGVRARTAYAARVLENACDAIATSRPPSPGQPGTRHETLIRMAMRVMAYVKGGELDDDTAVMWLTNAARRVGLDDKGTVAAIDSARIRATARTSPPLTNARTS